MSANQVRVVFQSALAGLLFAVMPAVSQQGPPVSQPSYPVQLTAPMPGGHVPPAQPPGLVRQIPVFRPPHGSHSGNTPDPVVQTSTPTPSAAQSLSQWEGLGAGYPGFTVGAVPPDPNMAVGPNHIVQWVNNNFVIFDKHGNQLQGPVADSTFWGTLSTCYQGGGFSDPVIKYDRAADRWVVGEVAIPVLPGFLGQYAQCFAVSKTSDPTYTADQNGNNTSYYIWAYGFGTTLNDYDKIAVWSDGYYVTWNIFQNGSTFSGAEACAWNRADMLGGSGTPRFKCFQLSSSFASLLGADVDGATAPPAGSPEYFMDVDPSSGALNLWKFHFNPTSPSSSTFTGPTSISGVAPFTGPCLTQPQPQDCIPQPNTTQTLDALGDRLMYRVGYRNFGDHESLVANHTVVAAGGNTGVRWYEVRSPNGTPTIYQQGTFAPDSDNRWMASVAMDQAGNIGVGYSVASAATYPSIRYTGWRVGDALGTLQAETSLAAGGGSQTGYDRWGDYSLMVTDPSDDCTFWYTNEYQATTQSADWNTRIGSFKFSNCGQALTPTTTTVSSSGSPSVYGQSVTFTATVAPAGATGTVTFKDGSTTLGSGPLNGSGAAAFSTSSLATGGHSITATYGGDTTHAGSTSSAVGQTVNQAGTSTALASSLNPTVFGQPVTFTATVTAVAPGAGTPTGTVTFKDGASMLGSAALNGSGTATYSTSTLAAGPHSITAAYNGDTNFTASTSSGLSQTVNQANTSTALTSSVNPSSLGQSVTFTATVTAAAPGAGTPTGEVAFKDGATTLGSSPLNASGTAAYSTSALTAGGHSITAVYNGSTNFTGSTSLVLSQTVNQTGTSTALGSSPNPSTFGQSVMFTATVTGGSGAPTGTVTFKDGGTAIGSSGLTGSGIATLSTSSLATGGHSITAVYGGDTTHGGSTSPVLSQTVNQANTSTALSSSAPSSTYGQQVTFTATVTAVAPGAGTPTGTVTFKDGGTTLSSAALNAFGAATYSLSTLAVGSHSITAVYGGDTNFTGGTSTALTQTVSQAGTSTALSSSLNPSNFGQSVTFTATVTAVAPGAGTPTGTVTFKDGAITLSSAALNASGTATYSTPTLAAGSHSITAAYGGNTNFAGSGSPTVTQTVNKVNTTTTLTSSPNPSNSGQTVTFTATISPSAATGTVQFFNGGTLIGSAAVSGGKASLPISTLPVGTDSIHATYSGDSNDNGSTSAVLTQTVRHKK